MKQKKWVKRPPSKTKELAEPKPTPRAKTFIDLTIKEPHTSHRELYQRVYKGASDTTARANAAHLMKRESTRVYLKKHEKMAKQVIVEVMKNAYDNREKVAWQRLAFDSANSILDRQIGKPIQSVKNENTNLNVNVEASQELSDQFAEFLRANTTQ